MKTLEKKSIKRTYILPAEVMAQFETLVPAGKRGAALGEAVARWLEEKRLSEIRARMEEFYDDEESQTLYAQIDRECSPASDELWAALPDEEWPEPVIVFPYGYAAYLAQTEPKRGTSDGQ